MSAGKSLLRGQVVAIAAVLALAATGSAVAQGHGGGGGGGHAAVGGGARGGYGGVRGGYGGFRGGYYGGYRGGYGWRGGWGWGCCGWGLGWYLPFLPLGYATYYWGGVPYYYVDNNYYVWDGSAGQYQAVQPPTGLTSTPPPAGSAPAGAAPGGPPGQWTDLFAYPKGGQSMEQQTRDRDECHKWAVGQTGYDPAQPPAGNSNDALGKREGYLRAETACLEGRNYSVK
jgi:hypothetical protein